MLQKMYREQGRGGFRSESARDLHPSEKVHFLLTSLWSQVLAVYTSASSLELAHSSVWVSREGGELDS